MEDFISRRWCSEWDLLKNFCSYLPHLSFVEPVWKVFDNYLNRKMELVTGEEGHKHTSDLSFFMQTLVWYIRLPGECYIQAKKSNFWTPSVSTDDIIKHKVWDLDRRVSVENPFLFLTRRSTSTLSWCSSLKGTRLAETTQGLEAKTCSQSQGWHFC